MGLDERIFAWLHRGWISLGRRESRRVRERAADAERLLPRLRVLAGAAAGRDVEVALVDGPGGIRGDAVLMPARFGLLASVEDNERLLLVRATLAGRLLHEGLAGHGEGLPALEARLREELPGWGRLRDRLPAELPLDVLVGRVEPGSPRPLVAPADAGAGHGAGIGMERASRRRPPARRRRRLAEHDDAENPFTHSFEKVHTLELHPGGAKRADGGDELADHHAALEELELDEVVVSSEPARSVYRAEAPFLGEAASTSVTREGLPYDEWDSKRRRYLARYCSLRVETPALEPAAGERLALRLRATERTAIVRTRAELLRLESALSWHTRQLDGSDVDVDALVDRHAAVAAGHDDSTRLYVSKRRRARSLAVLLLLDVSLSTDGWVQNRRILDVERDAAALFALAARDVLDELGMAAFYSFSHEDCRFVALKAFREPLSRGFARLAAVEPRGYTRIGPALRHATRVLSASSARRRAVVVLSDGKPSDIDSYEGRHGIGDVRQAVREARRSGVDVFAFGADPRARHVVARLFGAHGHAGLGAAGDVSTAVAALVSRLRANQG